MKKTEGTCRKFLDELSSHGNVSRAAKAAGVTRQAIYQWRDSDEFFHRAWDNAIGEFLDEFEEQIIDRARNGVEFEVINKDGEVVTVRGRPSDTLAKFILQSRRYQPTRKTDINVKVTARNLVKLTDAELAKVVAADIKSLPEHVEDASFEEEPEDLLEEAAVILESHRR